jgi:hypothetical protein
LIFRITLGTLVQAAMFAAAPTSAEIEKQLEAAIHREIVLGDLKGAMEQYKAILAQPAKSRPVAARALIQIGQCLETSGRRAEARNVYSQVLKEYGDQPQSVAYVQARLAKWANSIPGPLNLKFDQGEPGKLPFAWFVAALPNEADQWAQFRNRGCMNGGTCAVVLVPENAPVHVGHLMQSFSATAYRGKTIRFRAWLRLEAVDAGDHAQIWLSVDRSGNMSDRPVRSSEWTPCEIRTRIGSDATFIRFGVMSIGRGSVWVDNVSFETVAQN